MKFLGYQFRHYFQKWLKLAEILLSVAVRLSLCALGSANVKKQASPAQLLLQWKMCMRCLVEKRTATFIYNCQYFNFSDF